MLTCGDGRLPLAAENGRQGRLDPEDLWAAGNGSEMGLCDGSPDVGEPGVGPDVRSDRCEGLDEGRNRSEILPGVELDGDLERFVSIQQGRSDLVGRLEEAHMLDAVEAGQDGRGIGVGANEVAVLREIGDDL